MARHSQNLSMYAGETKTISLTVTNETTGALVDFTDATISWVVKDETATAILTKTVGSGITVTGTGTFTIALTTGNTTGLSGDYRHEARATLSDGTVATLFDGTLSISPTLVP